MVLKNALSPSSFIEATDSMKPYCMSFKKKFCCVVGAMFSILLCLLIINIFIITITIIFVMSNMKIQFLFLKGKYIKPNGKNQNLRKKLVLKLSTHSSIMNHIINLRTNGKVPNRTYIQLVLCRFGY